MLGDPRTPQALVFLLVARSDLLVLRESFGVLGQLKHALFDQQVTVNVRRWQDGEQVGGRDACAGHTRGEEDTFAKGRVGVHVEVFFTLAVRASS